MFGLSVTVIFLVIGMSFGQECNPYGERIDCGYDGIDQSECEDARGCCWNDEMEDVPWCYRNTTKTCDPEQSRLDCVASCGYTSRERPDFAGFLGIDEPGCIERGCCWEESQQEGEPWCFFPVRDCEVEERTDCGYVGIGVHECLGRRCCYNQAINEPWCFFSNRNCEPTAPRQDCGYLGIDEYGCLARDCCWEPSDKNGEPWCFAPSSD